MDFTKGYCAKKVGGEVFIIFPDGKRSPVLTHKILDKGDFLQRTPKQVPLLWEVSASPSQPILPLQSLYLSYFVLNKSLFLKSVPPWYDFSHFNEKLCATIFWKSLYPLMENSSDLASLFWSTWDQNHFEDGIFPYSWILANT